MKSVKWTLFTSGYCKQLEAVSIAGGRLKSIRFPALFSLIEHPEMGPILFDTGYANHFVEAVKSFPNRLYALTTPVCFQAEDSTVHQISRLGYRPEDVGTIIISHFHADHFAGLRDFPKARFICTRQAYASVQHLKGWAAVKHAFLPELLPSDFESRLHVIEPSQRIELPESYAPLSYGYDVLGDGSMVALDLPGHAAGQIGLWVHDEKLGDVLLAADAAWSSQAIRKHTLPSRVAYLIKSNPSEYRKNFRLLCELSRVRPDLTIIPSHCSEMEEAWVLRQGDKP